jgi:hypothetical protein
VQSEREMQNNQIIASLGGHPKTNDEDAVQQK